MGRVGCMLAGLGVASHDALDAATRARLSIALLQNEMAAIKPVRFWGARFVAAAGRRCGALARAADVIVSRRFLFKSIDELDLAGQNLRSCGLQRYQGNQG
jgi:hypothetical protein